MRLLERHKGNFRLTDDLYDGEIPAYAILSHTWGTRQDEVTFKDMVERTGRQKPGYRKIRFCAEEAAKDGLEFFWVDSCCIDKSSSAEVQEAITSMFRWYLQAAKCYVYLADVSTIGIYRRVEWEPAFRNSRWFTRGWTLQEMIASPAVEFFSREGKRLGDKEGLEDLLRDITGVSVKALRGEPLSGFEVTERFSWTQGRNTTRPEDEAYCLMGIFGVFIPVLYGEGKQSAISRLEEQLHKVAASRQNDDRHKHNPRYYSTPGGRVFSDGAESLMTNDRPLTRLDETVVKAPVTQTTARQGQKDAPLHESAPAANVADLQTPEQRWSTFRVLNCYSAEAHCVAFSPNGKFWASILNDRTAKIWDCRSGAMVCSLSLAIEEADKAILLFTDDGKMLAIRWSRGVTLWDTRTWSESRTIRTAQASSLRVACSSDGSRLAIATKEGTIEHWNTQSGELLDIITVHSLPPTKFSKFRVAMGSRTFQGLRYSPDGSLLASGTGRIGLCCWNLREGVEPFKNVLAGIEYCVTSIAFSSNGQSLAAGSIGGEVTLWACSPTPELHNPRRLWPETRPNPIRFGRGVADLAFAPGNGLLIVAFYDFKVRLFDCQTGHLVRTINKIVQERLRHPSGHRTFLSADGSCLAVTVGIDLWIWNLVESACDA